MRAVTADEMRRIDDLAIREYGIPSLLLMENAGKACAQEVLNLVKRQGASVAIFSGKGNNGGDGFVTARHLANQRLKPIVFYFHSPSEMKSDPLTNFKILEKMKIPMHDFSKNLRWEEAEKILQQSAAVVDALFGTGLSKPVGEPFKKAIEIINQSKLPVISVDIPSGLNADTGEVMGACVQATVTVSLGLPKKGFYLNQGSFYTGRVVVADISIPRRLLE